MSRQYLLPGNIHLTPEFRFVAAASWLPPSDAVLPQDLTLPLLSAADLNWEEVVSLVLRHGVVGQFCRNMGLRAWAGVPPEAKKRLNNVLTQQAVVTLSQVAELARFVRVFAEAGLPVIALKGVSLSQALYGDPCMRSSGDLDMLVRPENLEAALLLLEQNGYFCCLHGTPLTVRQRSYIRHNLYHLEFTNPESGLTVELHWRLGSLWQPEHMGLVWENLQSRSLAGNQISCLDSCIELLFLADHGARHRFCCLKWLGDIVQIFAAFPADEWERLIELADRLDLKLTLAHTALLVHWIYRVPLAGPLLELLREEKRSVKLSVKVIELLSLRAATHIPLGKRLGSLAFAWQVQRLRRSLPLHKTLKPSLIAAADFHDFPLPDTLFWLYYPLRPMSWLWRYYKSG